MNTISGAVIGKILEIVTELFGETIKEIGSQAF